MKKLIIICMGVFLVMWGLSADVMASGKNHGKKVVSYWFLKQTMILLMVSSL